MEEGRLDQRESDENGVASVTDLVIDYEEILVSLFIDVTNSS